jgi:membrane fusion protein (multidrug efflux system)
MDDLSRTAEPTLSIEARYRLRRNRTVWARLALLCVLVAGVLVSTGYWYMTQDQVSTDDAYTDGKSITIAPQVAGTVVALDVTDNQRVKAGDTLIEIDPRAYDATRDEAAATLRVAEAELDNARLKLETARIDYPAQLAGAQARLEAAEAVRVKADADARRQLALPRQATMQQDIDAAVATRRNAEAQVAMAQAALKQADMVRQFIAGSEAQAAQLEAQVALARARLDQAELNLSWTRVTAPQDGWVTRRAVEKGNYVQAGQAIMALVTPDIWITANFKESQLDRIRVGQKVDIEVDAYSHLKLTGHIDSIQRGSGARFAAFPAENATGNFVKIVQRVPVKIVIDSGLEPDVPLPLGLSVDPTVHLK